MNEFVRDHPIIGILVGVVIVLMLVLYFLDIFKTKQ